MELQSHELVDEFPEYREKIHVLKTSNHHFTKLLDEYHQVNREVVRIEQEVEPVTDEFFEDLKKKRLLLKDQLYAMLHQA